MFEVTDPSLIETAVLLLRWPFEYVSKPGNSQTFLAPHYATNPGLEMAVRALIKLQSSLPALPSNESVWREVVAILEDGPGQSAIRTEWPQSDAHLFSDFIRTIDVPLYESISIALHRKKSIEDSSCDRTLLRTLTQCMWLSSLIALCVLGTARAVLDGPNVVFEVTGSSSGQALRRAWFGVVFDLLARTTDEASLTEDLMKHPLQRMRLLHFFAKQWRLGLPFAEDGRSEGMVVKSFDSVLLPSARLLSACLRLNRIGRTLTSDDSLRLGCIEEFHMIERYMRQLPMSDRAFVAVDSGLVPGPLQLVPALLSVSEQIAREKMGEGWHTALGDEMVRYLASRIDGTPGVRVINVELVQHVTSNNTPIDIDLFIVDDRIGRTYAVQCKHFESSFGIDLLDWLERFRRSRGRKRQGLDKALQQLSNLDELCRKDERVRQALLNSVGLTSNQIETLRPIVVHNLWNLDFWRTDQGICFYDLHTFCNALKCREATMTSVRQGRVVHHEVQRSEEVVDMSDPDSVIEAYVNDPRWQHLSRFDAMAKVRRQTVVDGLVIAADGLGL